MSLSKTTSSEHALSADERPQQAQDEPVHGDLERERIEFTNKPVKLAQLEEDLEKRTIAAHDEWYKLYQARKRDRGESYSSGERPAPVIYPLGKKSAGTLKSVVNGPVFDAYVRNNGNQGGEKPKPI